jgi:hypothetical protein
MSQENVELIVGLQVEPSDDWAWIVHDDATWAALGSTVSDLFHPDFESTIPLFGSAKDLQGIEGAAGGMARLACPVGHISQRTRRGDRPG